MTNFYSTYNVDDIFDRGTVSTNSSYFNSNSDFWECNNKLFNDFYTYVFKKTDTFEDIMNDASLLRKSSNNRYFIRATKYKNYNMIEHIMIDEIHDTEEVGNPLLKCISITETPYGKNCLEKRQYELKFQELKFILENGNSYMDDSVTFQQLLIDANQSHRSYIFKCGTPFLGEALETFSNKHSMCLWVRKPWTYKYMDELFNENKIGIIKPNGTIFFLNAAAYDNAIKYHKLISYTISDLKLTPEIIVQEYLREIKNVMIGAYPSVKARYENICKRHKIHNIIEYFETVIPIKYFEWDRIKDIKEVIEHSILNDFGGEPTRRSLASISCKILDTLMNKKFIINCK